MLREETMDAETLAPGSGEADFNRWFRAHHARLRAFCTRYVGDAATAEDVTQETLLRAWARRASFEQDGDIRSWLYCVARNLCVEHLRARTRLVAHEELPEHPDHDADPIVPLERAEERRLIREALGAVSERHRTFLVARDVEGLGYEELAARFGLSEESARAVLFRARRGLRERFIAATGTLVAAMIAIKIRITGALRRASDVATTFTAADVAIAHIGLGLAIAGAIAGLQQPAPARGTERVASTAAISVAPQAVRASTGAMRAPDATPRAAAPSRPLVRGHLDRAHGDASVETTVRNPVTGDDEHAWMRVWRKTGNGDSVVLTETDKVANATCEIEPEACAALDGAAAGALEE